MDDRILEDGEAVYQLGDSPDSIFAVLEGCVLVTTADAGGNPIGQALGPGSVYDFCLALGAGRTAPRIRAFGATTVRLYSRQEAVDAARAGDGGIARVLAKILRIADGAVAPAPPGTATPGTAAPDEQPAAAKTVEIVDDDPPPIGGDPDGEATRVRLIIAEDEIADRVEFAEYDLYVFPFIVGREDGEGLHANIDLTIPDSAPYQLSRRHFLIDDRDGEIQVVDCNSYHGTIVNGKKLGGGATSFRVALPPGENTIVAGTEDSEFRFVCLVGTEDNPIVDP